MESTLRRIIQNDQAISACEYRELFQQAFTDSKKKALLVALLTALSAKKTNINDISAFVSFVESEQPKIRLSSPEKVANIVGTGGGLSTFNVSTTAAIVAAAAGAHVVKSGSAAYTSQCGSHDLLKQLGIDLVSNEEEVREYLDTFGIAFIAPSMYPPILKRIAISILPLSMREIGLFVNLAGPLLCPIAADHMVCGVSALDNITVFTSLLRKQRMNSAYVVHGEIGVDELSPVGKNNIIKIDLSQKEAPDTMYNLDPTEYGMNYKSIEGLSGGTPKYNARKVYAILSSEAEKIAEDIVVLNAAHILIGTNDKMTLEQAIQKSRETIHSGKARALLDQLAQRSGNHLQTQSKRLHA